MKSIKQLILPSNKTIPADNIKHITEIELVDYPDVFVEFYYTFNAIYTDKKLALYYKTKQSAELDKIFIEEFLSTQE